MQISMRIQAQISHHNNIYICYGTFSHSIKMQTTVTLQLVHCSTHCRQCALTAVISSSKQKIIDINKVEL